MKKLLSILLSAILVLALSACTINIGGLPQQESADTNATVSNPEKSEDEKVKTDESKPEESKKEESKKEESKKEESKKEESKPAESKPAESKPATSKPAESKPAATNPSSSSSSSTTKKPDAVTSSSPLRRPIEEEKETKTEIKQERAIEIALKKAGADLKDVFRLKAEYDKDDDGNTWEVEFNYKGFEYTVEIDALTEVIRDYEREPIEFDD